MNSSPYYGTPANDATLDQVWKAYLLWDDKLFATENMRVDTYAPHKEKHSERLLLENDKAGFTSSSIALGLRIGWSCCSWHDELRAVMCSLFEVSEFTLRKWGVLEEDEHGALNIDIGQQELRHRMVEAFSAERIRNMVIWSGGPYHFVKLSSPDASKVQECLGYYAHLWPRFIKYQIEISRTYGRCTQQVLNTNIEIKGKHVLHMRACVDTLRNAIHDIYIICAHMKATLNAAGVCVFS